jgi:tetratricopeptide (TPR) repeat protein
MERLKRIMMMVAVAIMMLAGTVFAGINEAKQLYKDAKWAEAEVEFRKVLPTLEGAEASNAQFHIGYCFYGQKKCDEAIVEFKKIASIPEAHPSHISGAQLHIGYFFYGQKKYDEAILELKKIASIPEAYPSHISSAQLYIGYSLDAQGKKAEAQAEYIKVFSVNGAPVSHMKTAYSKLDKVSLGKEGLLEVIDTILLNVPATEANAEFLGLLKSEQEKLK